MFSTMAASFVEFSVIDKVLPSAFAHTVKASVIKTIGMTRGVTIARPSTYGGLDSVFGK